MVSERPTRKVIRELVSVTVPDGHRFISPGVYRQILQKIKETNA